MAGNGFLYLATDLRVSETLGSVFKGVDGIERKVNSGVL